MSTLDFSSIYQRVIPRMKTMKLFNPDDQLNAGSQYLFQEYRQKLLRISFLLCIVIAIGMLIVNLREWISDPLGEWGLYNLISDGAALVIFSFLYWANRKGFVALSGWSFGFLILTAIPTIYSLQTINQAFLVVALPIALSSFIIQPWASFIFAGFVIVSYNVTFFEYPGAFDYDIFSLLALLFIAVSSYLVSSILNKAISDTTRAYDETIQGWAKALEMRDSETMGHSQRIVELTLLLAKRLGVNGIDLFHIRRGALLHDIGKMGIPDAILHKPGKLTEEEWIIMRKHPVYARDYLFGVSYLAQALEIPYFHHERWDGTGYPQGLKGEAIPLAARIFAVVDVWDALTSQRPYLETWTKEEALAYIQEQSGRHFDPRIVEAFTVLIKSKFEIKEEVMEDSVFRTRKHDLYLESQKTIPR
jgi:HD-GYP domain-containing protein (c-di-GMP phosphodiesterase class II)